MNKIKKLLFSSVILLQVLSVFAPFNYVKAYDFDPSFILSNDDIEDYNSMNLSEIQSFLSQANSFLANYIATDTDGYYRFGYEIIYNAAQRNRINPKWILVTLQKEQSLINSDSTPSQDRLDWAMGYGVCDSCAKDDPGIQKFRGFATQIDKAAARMRYYIENPYQFNFQPGQSAQIDDIAVTIKNRATALLYNYTPHIGGNRNFWKIWTRWFNKNFPDGTLLQIDGETGVWVIQNGLRRPLDSKAALHSLYGNQRVITTSPSYLSKYGVGLPIKFTNYSLVRSSAGDTYLLVNNERRKIASAEAFRHLGYNPDEVENISDEQLATYYDGRDIEAGSAYPIGKLIRDSKTGGVYFVENGFKYPIVSKDILKVNYPGKKIGKAKPSELAKFLTGQKIKIKDGTLIRSKKSATVYVISNGTRRPIVNEKTLADLGYDLKDVVVTSDEVLNLHPLGDALDSTINTVPLTATSK